MKLHKKVLLFYSSILIGTAISIDNLIAQSTSQSSTEGIISFIGNNDHNIPKDPNDPTKKPSQPDNHNHGNGNTGELTLTVAPNAFDFGTQLKYRDEHTYSAQGDFDQYLQVDDNREAGTHGWTLTDKQDRDLTDDSNGKKMTGITFYIPKGIVHNSLDALNPCLISDEANVETKNSSVIFKTNQDFLNDGKAISIDVWKASLIRLTIPRDTAISGNC